jgi:hypothetical protein
VRELLVMHGSNMIIQRSLVKKSKEMTNGNYLGPFFTSTAKKQNIILVVWVVKVEFHV